MQKLGILRILEYSKSFHNCIQRHIQNPVIFTKIYEDSELWHIRYIFRKIQDEVFFEKLVKNYNLFSKAFRLRYLTRFWIRLSLSKYLLTCRVTSRYVLYHTHLDSEPCQLLKIQAYSSPIQTYSTIVAYLEPCVTLACSESCHIQNPGIFRIQDIFRTLSRHIQAF